MEPRLNEIESLSSSEEWYRLVSELTSDYAYAFRVESDSTLVAEWMTGAFTRITGYTPEEVEAQGGWQILIYPQDMPIAVQRQQALLAGHQDKSEFRIVTKSGETRWLRDHGRPVWDTTEARVVRIIGAAQDITESRKAENALHEQLRRNEQILQTTMDGYILADTEGQLLDANSVYCEMVGYSRQELLQMNIRELEAALSPPDIKQRIEQMVSQGWARFETQHRHKEGRVVELEVSIVIMRSEANSIVAAFVRDITKRKQTEEALQKSEERFRLAFRTSPDSININRLEDGLYVDINEGFTTITGYTREDVIGRTSLEINIWDNPVDREKLVAELREHGYVNNLEATFRLKGGRVTTGLMSARTIMLSDVPHILSITRDIQDLKQTQETLQQRAQELATLNTLSRQVGGSLSLDQVVQSVLDGVVDTIKPDIAVFFLREEDNLVLQGIEPRDSSLAQAGPPIHCLGECLCGLAASEGVCIYSHDIHTDPRCTWEECKKAGICSFVALPLKHGEDVIGILGLASRTKRDFSKQSDFLEALAAQVSIGVQNALLYQQAERHAAELELRVTERTTELQESQEKLRRQYKRLPVPTYTWQKTERDIVLVDHNDAAEELAQGRMADFVGMKAAQIYHDRPDIQQDLSRCLEEKTTIRREMDYQYAMTGVTRSLAVKYAFVPPDLVLVHTEDITDRVRAQEELREQAAKLGELVGLMAGREVRMAELKKAIRQLRTQLEVAGLEPVADDPLAKWMEPIEDAS